MVLCVPSNEVLHNVTQWDTVNAASLTLDPPSFDGYPKQSVHARHQRHSSVRERSCPRTQSGDSYTDIANTAHASLWRQNPYRRQNPYPTISYHIINHLPVLLLPTFCTQNAWTCQVNTTPNLSAFVETVGMASKWIGRTVQIRAFLPAPL